MYILVCHGTSWAHLLVELTYVLQLVALLVSKTQKAGARVWSRDLDARLNYTSQSFVLAS